MMFGYLTNVLKIDDQINSTGIYERHILAQLPINMKGNISLTNTYDNKTVYHSTWNDKRVFPRVNLKLFGHRFNEKYNDQNGRWEIVLDKNIKMKLLYLWYNDVFDEELARTGKEYYMIHNGKMTYLMLPIIFKDNYTFNNTKLINQDEYHITLQSPSHDIIETLAHIDYDYHHSYESYIMDKFERICMENIQIFKPDYESMEGLKKIMNKEYYLFFTNANTV